MMTIGENSKVSKKRKEVLEEEGEEEKFSVHGQTQIEKNTYAAVQNNISHLERRKNNDEMEIPGSVNEDKVREEKEVHRTQDEEKGIETGTKPGVGVGQPAKKRLKFLRKVNSIKNQIKKGKEASAPAPVLSLAPVEALLPLVLEPVKQTEEDDNKRRDEEKTGSETPKEDKKKSKWRRLFFIRPKLYKLEPKPGHPIDWKKLEGFEFEVVNVLKHERPYKITHLREIVRTSLNSTSTHTTAASTIASTTSNITLATTSTTASTTTTSSSSTSSSPASVSRILGANAPRAPYERRRFVLKKELHWGQLKLFLTEIEFLSLALLRRTEQKMEHLQINFVYAGAAPGEHTQYLSNLFPMVHFHLYDPNQFHIEEGPSITIYNQFFTEIDAQYWQKKSLQENYVIFASDVRTEPATEETVMENMMMQLDWWKEMNPELAMFKFRLPWKPGKTQYAAGDIYIQPYPGATSTESRLIVPKGAPIIEYDNKKYEEQFFYHNTITRSSPHGTQLGNSLTIEKDGVCNCYDCASFIWILDNYLKATKTIKTEDGIDGIELEEKKEKEQQQEQQQEQQENRERHIYRLINEVQENITFGKHNIYVQTVRNLNFQFDHFERYAYRSCGDVECKICGTFRETADDDISKVSSVQKYGIETNAYNENLYKAIREAKKREKEKDQVKVKDDK